MSRFFATGSDSESESSSEEEQLPRQPTAAFTFSDEEEDTKRIVRSAKEKRYEELMNLIRNIRNYKKIKDMSSMLTSFEDLMRAYTKALPVISKEENGQTPRFYVRCLVEMDDFITEVWEFREGRKNMSKNNSKSLTSIRQKLRKYTKEFEEDMAKFRANPDQPDEEEEEERDVEGDSEPEEDKPGSEAVSIEPSKSVKVAVQRTPGTEEDDGSEDSSDWGSDTDSESDSSGDDAQYTNMRDRFLKQRYLYNRCFDFYQEKPIMFAKDAEIDVPLVVKKLSEIVAARGKKRTDRRQQIELLHELQAVADAHNLGPAVAVKIKFAIISSIYDYNPKVSDAMKPEFWSKLLVGIEATINLLLTTPDLTVGEHIIEDSEVFDKPPYRVRGCVLTTVERLDEEFTKLLKECDPHSNEYVDRENFPRMLSLVFKKWNVFVNLCTQKMALTGCELGLSYPTSITMLYMTTGFKPGISSLCLIFRKLFSTQTQRHRKLSSDTGNISQSSCLIFRKLSSDTGNISQSSCHIFRKLSSDTGKYFTILRLYVFTCFGSHMILYNRTMAHLGLCAFRHSNIKDAHNCLVDLMMTGKVKELLAQGLLPQRQHERSKEQEKIEKQRQMPFHMHINLELLECVYLVSAMLIEIPYMAAHEFDARRRMISKTFYQQLRSSERQSLVGPPESMREHVVAASKAMRNGNWAACKNFIINEKMNAKVWDLFHCADKVREMLTRLIQEEALRTYLFTYSNVYDSISMSTLAEMFELDLTIVHSTISKMIINEELMASLDDPTQTVVMHRSEPTRLQALALQLTDKVNNFVDANERIFEMKQGNFFNRSGNQGGFRDRQNFNRQGQDWNRQRRDNRNY
uniref:Eukaryotic translation initiation factor 3 subunit C n=1 Tax=Timema genevievae TaxID=629358 RepID=A0A7R9PJW8_TIMGE|nr:unnamed protein product [Timema genevievae]